MHASNRFVCRALLMVSGATAAHANVDLRLQDEGGPVLPGDVVRVALSATSDTGADQPVAAIEAILGWDPDVLELLPNDDTGGPPLIVSGFTSPDPFGLNESSLPADGDAMYFAFGQLGNPFDVSPTGTLITTLRFLALAPARSTMIDLLATAGDPPGTTRVFSGEQPNLEITGTITGTKITIVPSPATACLAIAPAGVGRRRRPARRV